MTLLLIQGLLLVLLVAAAVGSANAAKTVFHEDGIAFPTLERHLPPDQARKNFVSATLGSNMVLQRGKSSMIWGQSKPGATITTVLRKGNSDPYPTLTTTAGNDGLWRQALPVQNATNIPHSIRISSTSGESARLDNVLFGDVYLCGGQSNMQFTMDGTTNGTIEAKRGNNYPHIRLFTVGQDTNSPDKALLDLATVLQPWTVANEISLASYGDTYPFFGYFASTCFFFGREIADGLNNEIPIGLISSNWGGTMIELWMEKGGLFNAMIHPYMVGPMALSGFAWYQGEANAKNYSWAKLYETNFPTMIRQWRSGFQAPESFFGFIQLSTWCPPEPEAVSMLREAQMAALSLPTVGYATNADHGAGCNVHPPPKQYCAKRLANSALALVYGADMHWKSPSYSKATATKTKIHSERGNLSSRFQVTIDLVDVTTKGLYMMETPFNERSGNFTFRCGPKLLPLTCAWGAVKMSSAGWLNATISIKLPDQVILTVAVDKNGEALSKDEKVLETSYGWGSVPMMTLYDAGTDLPVLPWKKRIDGQGIHTRESRI